MRPLVGRSMPAIEVQERRLPRARRAHQGDEIPLLDLEREAVEDGEDLRVAGVLLDDVLDPDEGFGHVSPRQSFFTRTFCSARHFTFDPAASATISSPPDDARCDLDLAPGLRPQLERAEDGRSVLHEEDPLLPVDLDDRRRRDHHLRLRLRVDLRLGVQEDDPARHLGEDPRVPVEDLDLDLHRALLPVGRRDDLAEARLVGLVGVRVEGDLGRLPDGEAPEVLLVDVGLHLERAEVDDDGERGSGRPGAAEALRGDRLADERLLHRHDAVDRGVDLGVLDQLLDVAHLRLDRGDLGLERLDARVGGVEGLLAPDEVLEEGRGALPLDPGVDELGQRLLARGGVLLPLGLQLLRLEAGDELALPHLLPLLEVQPGDAPDRLRGDLGLAPRDDVARGGEDRRGLGRRHEGDARRRRPPVPGTWRRSRGPRRGRPPTRTTRAVATVGRTQRPRSGRESRRIFRAERSAVRLLGSMRLISLSRRDLRDSARRQRRSAQFSPPALRSDLRVRALHGFNRPPGRRGATRGRRRRVAPRSGGFRWRRGGRSAPSRPRAR